MIFLSLASLNDAPLQAPAIELRVDLLETIQINAIQRFIKESTCPILLTLRKKSQGGNFQGTEFERESLIKRLLALEPAFFDLEHDMRTEFLNEALHSFPKTRFILSYHNFQEVPPDLESVYETMSKYPVFGYKIAAHGTSTLDAFRLLLFAKSHPQVSVICMGARGEFARVLAPVCGNQINYARPDDQEAVAPGQLSYSELLHTYRYATLNPKTHIYGLIGDPIEKSPGHVHHNGVFHSRGYNAVYVKMTVKQEELPAYISQAKVAGIKGVSVTIPLKEAILPFVDEMDDSAKKIGAVNTLKFEKGKIIGTNTDGLGALDAIEKKGAVAGKKMVLLGAGGAARAIAYEAQVRGAQVWVLNRTIERAKKLGSDLGCESGSLDDIPHQYDILVNCSPEYIPMNILPQIIAMDVVYAPRETEFLKTAALKGCQIVYGEEMYLNQAARQTQFWLGA